MTPREKLQKKIDDKRIEIDRAEVRVEVLAGELRILQQTMTDLFGVSERRATGRGGRPTDAAYQAEQEKLLKVLDAAPDEGLTTRQICEGLDLKFDETVRSRINQRLQRGVEKGALERVSEGRFRIKRASLSSVVPA